MSPVKVIALHEMRTLVRKPAFIFSYAMSTIFVVGFSALFGGAIDFGDKEMETLGAGMWMGMAFFMVIATTTTHLLHALLEEKSSRVIEIVLSAVSTEELLKGKIAGIVGLAFAQVASWMVLSIAGSEILARSLGNPGLDLDPGRGLLMVAFAVAGLFMFAALIAAGGALVNDMKEAQSVTMVVIFSAMIPWQLGLAFSQSPNPLVQKIFSLFPLTAPTAMIMRLASGAVPAWEAALSFALVAVTAVGVLRIGSTAFDLGLLSTGRRIAWKTVLDTYLARRRV